MRRQRLECDQCNLVLNPIPHWQPVQVGEYRSDQWRRQTIKSGSSFKGQLYLQVGQMEGPKVPSVERVVRSAGTPTGGHHSPSPLGSPEVCRIILKKSTLKSRIFCKLNLLILQTEVV